MSIINVGNSPCSWGALEFDELAGEKIGYQQMLDELVETGYTGTELGDWGFMPTEADALRIEMESRDLTLLAAFVPVALGNPEAHNSGEADALKVAKLLAEAADRSYRPLLVLSDDNGADPVRTRNAGRISPEMGLSASEWRTFAAGAERIAGAVLAETGLRTVFHHHCAGFVETPDEIAHLLELTDPSLLGLVFDTGHYVYGSGEYEFELVLEGLRRFSDRISYLHFKDCDPGVAYQSRYGGWDYFRSLKKGVFCELGRGCVDFSAVVDWLRSIDYSGWVCVEQDVLPSMGSPKESALRNRKFLRNLGL